MTKKTYQVNCVCDIDCEKSEHVQLCGSDGTTYQSICHLKQAKCMQQKSINVVNNERCGKLY
jgi:hypothetical protein